MGPVSVSAAAAVVVAPVRVRRSGPAGTYGSDHDAVRGWDRAYLIAAAKREACGVDANAVAQYFPIDKGAFYHHTGSHTTPFAM